jgi:DNA-binding transcriptional ArsR family regulator
MAEREAVFDALGDQTRRAILDLLAEGPRPVAELAAHLPVSRPAVSLHLKVLRDAGLVRDRAVGTRRIYRLDPGGLQLLRTYLDRMWSRALDSFANAAEQAHAAEVAARSRSTATSPSQVTESANRARPSAPHKE